MGYRKISTNKSKHPESNEGAPLLRVPAKLDPKWLSCVRVAQTLNHERHMVKYVMALLYAAEIRAFAKNVET